jgi:hypothetical protein
VPFDKTLEEPLLKKEFLQTSSRKLFINFISKFIAMMDLIKCPCGSEKTFSSCCEPYFSILNLSPNNLEEKPSLIGWLDRYSPPIIESFMNKLSTYIYRVSWYLDEIINQYYHLDFQMVILDMEAANKVIFALRENILLSLFRVLSFAHFLRNA